MHRVLQRVSRMLSRSLSDNEREAVLGDLAECQATPFECVTQLLGLVVRRWIAGWRTANSWVAMAGIAIPCGIALSFVTRWWAESASAQISMYLTVWFPGYFAYPGTRTAVASMLLRLLTEAAALCAWSWTLGVAIVRLSHQLRTTVAIVLFALLFAATTGTSTTLARHGTPEGFLRPAILVMVVRFALVVAPLLFAASRPTALHKTAVAVTVATVATVLTLVTVTGVEKAFTFGRGVIPAPGPDGIVGTADDVRMWIPWIPIVMLWPAWYSTLSAVRGKDARRQ